MERLLRDALQARPDAPEDACIDAELLAAWADDGLNSRERVAVDAHVADCARCQLLVATMVRTMPLDAATETMPERRSGRSWWKLPAVEWLAPLAAAAAALVIWMAVPSRAPMQVSDQGAVAVDQAAPTNPLSAPPSARPADAGADTRLASPTRTREAQPESQNSASTSAQPSADPSTLQKAAAPREAPERSADAGGDALSGSVPSPNQIAPPAVAAPAASPAVPAAGSPAATPSPALSAASGRLETFASERRLANANQLETVVVSSNPSTRFGLLRGGGVQRSADGGATWREEVTGARDTLTAGASPSPSVCWLVGPSGIVLLSTDGHSWRRLAFPEAVDLRSVTATDSDNATVNTADGRAFVTADGGRSWERTGG
jgi:hypothetical protein